MSVAAVVLAAGFSRRLGRPKQLLRYEGEILVERMARIAAEAGLSPVIVVTAVDAAFREVLEARGFRCVVNTEAAEGMASSIRCGVAAAKDAGVDGVVLLACDQPAVDVQHLRRLTEDPMQTAASMYGGVCGVPAYFPKQHFEQLEQLQGDVGARKLLQTARAVVNDALAFDVDTPEDAAKLIEE